MSQLPLTVDLNETVSIVTGGGGVLCSEMAKALAACGSKVVVMSRRIEPLQEVVEEIEKAGGTAMAVSCDVTDLDSLRQANDKVKDAYGPCDILVNGAGGNHPKGTASIEQLTQAALKNRQAGQSSFFELDPEGIRFVFDVNLLGTVLATQIFARDMAESGGGTVINISSMSSYTPLTKVMSYSAAKAAVNSFTQWLAVHLAGTGVRVNAIAPGFFLTEQNHDLLKNPDGSDTDRGGLIMSNTPMKRYGEPDELLGALLWLSSPAASGFVTGAVIPIDGGFAAFSGV